MQLESHTDGVNDRRFVKFPLRVIGLHPKKKKKKKKTGKGSEGEKEKVEEVKG
jgi:hypothetical protein